MGDKKTVKCSGCEKEIQNKKSSVKNVKKDGYVKKLSQRTPRVEKEK